MTVATVPADGGADLLGSWTLASYAVSHGRTPFGTRPGGLLSYTPDGMMSAHLVALDDDAPQGASRYVAYFGRFSVDPERRTVTHHLVAASQADLAGQDLERQYERDGDMLSLRAVSVGATHHLAWRRAGAGR